MHAHEPGTTPTIVWNPRDDVNFHIPVHFRQIFLI
jgi:hypothetical protein